MIYILQQDTSWGCKGDRYSGGKIGRDGTASEMYYRINGKGEPLPNVTPASPEFVENSPTFFLAEEDNEVKLAIDVLVKNGWAMFYENKAAKESESISSEFEIRKAKQLLENSHYLVFNDDPKHLECKEYLAHRGCSILNANGTTFSGWPNQYKYTEDDMRGCFLAAMNHFHDETSVERRYWCEDAFTEFLNSLNKK